MGNDFYGRGARAEKARSVQITLSTSAGMGDQARLAQVLRVLEVHGLSLPGDTTMANLAERICVAGHANAAIKPGMAPDDDDDDDEDEQARIREARYKRSRSIRARDVTVEGSSGSGLR